MLDEQRINPGHASARSALRVAGPMTFAVGGAFMLVGLVSFFSAFSGQGPPRLFWCCFVGMPLIAIGGMMTKFGFLGAITRYHAGEIAPVGKDTFNYLADETRTGVRTVATAIGTGLVDGSALNKLSCAACGQENARDARFCKHCGVLASRICPACGDVNDADAKFCDACGARLSTQATP